MQNLSIDSRPPPHNPVPTSSESKSARKKKAKAVTGTNGTTQTPAIPTAPGKEDSSLDAKADGESSTEHVYVKELQKQIRNINKKLSGMQKVDTLIAEHPDMSLDDLVAKRIINADQKNSASKKPGLQTQLLQLDENIQQYRKFEGDFQVQLQKQKDDLMAHHQKELHKQKEDLMLEGVSSGAAELGKKLLLFSQFLRCAAHKRTVEEEADTDEGRAFEGALLLVYGGDQKAVDTATKLIEGSGEQVPSIDGVATSVKCMSVLSCAPALIVDVNQS